MDLKLWKNADSEMTVHYLRNRGALLFSWRRLVGNTWVPECEEIPLGELLSMLGISPDDIEGLMYRDAVKYEKKSKRVEAQMKHHGWALQLPDGMLVPGTFGVTKDDCWGIAFNEVSSRVPGFQLNNWRHWDQSIRAAKKHGYKMVKVKLELS